MMSIPQVRKGILYFLYEKGLVDGADFSEIRLFLRKNKAESFFEDNDYSRKNLKELIKKMSLEGLVKEKYLEDECSISIYLIENKGIKIVENNLEELNKKWILN